jgi:hypothetical protein
LMFCLRLIQCSALSYARVLVLPTLATFACIAAFSGLSRAMSWGGWAQIFGAAAFVIVGTAISALGQRRAFLDEIARWQKRGSRAETREPAAQPELSVAS